MTFETAATSSSPPAPPPRVSAMDASPKGRSLTAAAQLFRTRGFAKTTVRELAAEVGIQSGSLFHHFKSKDAILESVMVEVIEFNTSRLIAARDAETDPVARLRALILTELNSISGDTKEAMGLLVAEWDALDGEAQSRVLVLRDRYEKLFLDAIEQARDRLVDIDPFILRRLIYGIQSGTRTWFNPDGPLSTSDLVDLVMKLARAQESS